MDDGDILGLRPKPVVQDHDDEDHDVEDHDVEHPEVQCDNPKDPRSEFLVQHCAGALNLNDVNSWSERNKHRYFLSTRTMIPLREKLEEFIGDKKPVDESLLVLSTLAKSFIAKNIERARIKNGMNFTSPISKNDLLERDFECLGVMSAI